MVCLVGMCAPDFVSALCLVLQSFAMKVVESGRQLIGPTGRPYDLILVDEAQVGWA